jgi:ubiquinol-cytochrome c reductase cytochrome b subunit
MVALVVINNGAPLDAPADPSSADYPAPPEWFFLSLFQMLKHFPGRLEWVGSIVIPSSVLLVFFLLPLLDRVLPSKLIHFLACMFLFALLGGAGYLTAEALQYDARDPQFRLARQKADEEEQRAIFLASNPDVGIPPEGAGFLMRRDPLTHGRSVVEKKCLSCHAFGLGAPEGKKPTASDIKDFGSRAWVRGLLENPRSPAYYGKAPRLNGMVEWKKSSELKSDDLDKVADFVASFASIPAAMSPAEWKQSLGSDEHPGQEAFETECGQCHVIEGFTEGGQRKAPNLFAWGSPQWITRMIRDPSAADLYGYAKGNDLMPPFGTDQLTIHDVDMVVRYLRNDYPKPLSTAKPVLATTPGQPLPEIAAHRR